MIKPRLLALLLLLNHPADAGTGKKHSRTDNPRESSIRYHSGKIKNPAILESPSGKIRSSFFVGPEGALFYSIHLDGKPIINSSRIGITVADKDLGARVVLREAQYGTVNETYPVRGSKSQAVNYANTIVIPIANQAGSPLMKLEARAYEDGVAWRLLLTGKGPHKVTGEASSWSLPEKSIIWFAERNNGWKLKTYAGEWISAAVEDMFKISSQGPVQCLPLVAQLPGETGYALITEAALNNYSGLRLRAFESGKMQADFTEGNTGFIINGPVTTPWRVTLLARDLNGLATSDLVANLNPAPDPKLYQDVDYIRPGRSVWRWWSSGTGSAPEEKKFIDYAAELGFEYSMVDDGWEDWTNSWNEIKQLAEYGRTRKVGIIIWSDVKNLRNPEGKWKQLTAFLDKAKAAGVAAVKLDFINSESKESIDFQIAALKLAAERRLMVIFHGVQKPTGEQRSFPNEITREGIRGLELNKIMTEGVISPRHNAALPFTRFVIGHGDYTPVGYSRAGATTWAHQLATMIQFTSPLQVIGENPELLLNKTTRAGLDLLKAIPSVWDETRVLPPSKIGEISLLARRHGDEWFLSGLTGDSAQILDNLSLSFLNSGSYKMLLLTSPGPANFTSIKQDAVTASASIDLSLAPGDGFVAWLRPDTLRPNYGITTLTPPRLDINPGPAYWPRTRIWQGIPSIERAPKGRLWATWYTGGIGEGKGQNHQLLVNSDDDGYTWSKPVAIFDPGRQLLGGEGGDPHLWLDPNGKLWWFVHRVMPSPGIHPRTCWGFYTDEPDSPKPVWKGPVFAGYGYSLNKGIVLSDGTWLQMIDPFSKSLDPSSPLTLKGAHLYKFMGYDKPFEHVGHAEIQETPFTEHMTVERKDRSLLMLARTQYGMAQTSSNDKGRTWTKSQPFTRDFNVNTRFCFQKLASGNLMLIVNDHPKNRQNMTAMLSEDDGKTWPYKLVLDEREFVSYPDATQAPDGTIYATYDRGRYQKDMQEILMAKFTEADIKAGKIISPTGRLKQTINKLADEGGGVRFNGETFEMTKQFQAMTDSLKTIELEEGEKAEYNNIKKNP